MTEPEFSIKKALEEAGTDAYLMTGNINQFSDIYYVTRLRPTISLVPKTKTSEKKNTLFQEMEKEK